MAIDRTEWLVFSGIEIEGGAMQGERTLFLASQQLSDAQFGLLCQLLPLYKHVYFLDTWLADGIQLVERALEEGCVVTLDADHKTLSGIDQTILSRCHLIYTIRDGLPDYMKPGDTLRLLPTPYRTYNWLVQDAVQTNPQTYSGDKREI